MRTADYSGGCVEPQQGSTDDEDDWADDVAVTDEENPDDNGKNANQYVKP